MGIDPETIGAIACIGPNGLGIYSHQKDKSTASIEGRDPRALGHEAFLSTSNAVIHQEEAEPATIVPGPQVVSIRKGGQARKFNWKKGQNVAKGVTKGLKGAFSSNQREVQLTEGQPYGAIPPAQDASGASSRSHSQDPRGFGFFGNQKNKPAQFKAPPSNGASPALPENPSGKFYVFASTHPLFRPRSNVCFSAIWNGIGVTHRV